jgi:hypothetical protein
MRRKIIDRKFSDIYVGIAEAITPFHSKKPVSLVEESMGSFGILFYENGSNRGR